MAAMHEKVGSKNIIIGIREKVIKTDQIWIMGSTGLVVCTLYILYKYGL